MVIIAVMAFPGHLSTNNKAACTYVCREWKENYPNVAFNSIGIYGAISGISFQTVKTLDSTLSEP